MSPRIQSGGEVPLIQQETPNGKIHFIRAKTDGDLVPEVPKTVNVLKSENAYFHVGEDVNIKDQKPFQCNSRIDKVSQQLHYTKPLQCDHRFSCSAAKGMFAHTNAAYISFLTILNTATLGSSVPSGSLDFIYNDFTMSDTSISEKHTSQAGRINGYRKSLAMHLNAYEDEFLNNKLQMFAPEHPGTVSYTHLRAHET